MTILKFFNHNLRDLENACSKDNWNKPTVNECVCRIICDKVIQLSTFGKKKRKNERKDELLLISAA